jgi:hypothetical protein
MHFPPGIADIPHLTLTMKVQMESVQLAIQPEKWDTQIARPAMLKKKMVVMTINSSIPIQA